jgi:hypothetical protein
MNELVHFREEGQGVTTPGRFPASFVRGLTCAAVLAAASPAGAQIVLKPLTPSQLVPPEILVSRIDANCAVFRDAIRTERPTEVAAVGAGTFTALDAGRRQQIAAMTDHVWVMQVWRQAGNLNWVRSVRLDAVGGGHVTQLCFRNDGTLARVRQAATVPALDTAAAQQAYFRTDGSMIRATALFERTDPAIPGRGSTSPYSRLR